MIEFFLICASSIIFIVHRQSKHHHLPAPIGRRPTMASRRLFPPIVASRTVLFIFAITGIAVLCHGFSSSAIKTNNYLTASASQHERHRHHRDRDGVCWLSATSHLQPSICRAMRPVGAAKSASATAKKYSSTKTATALPMGVFDYFRERFLDSRGGDFVPLEQSDDTAFGPGPMILMYAVPDSIDDEELRDMIQDGMPQRVEEGSDSSSTVVMRRLSGMDENGLGGDELLEASVREALDIVMGGEMNNSSSRTNSNLSGKFVVSSLEEQDGPCPVLYFSGVTNTEMMDTYRIIANEIYQATNGVHWPACAKVVRPAIEKSLRQVLSEISRDHADAMNSRREEAENVD